MSKKLLFKGGHATGMIPYEIEDFSTLYMVDARVDEKTKAYIDSVIGNSVLNLCPYRNVLVTHKYDTVEGNVVTLDDCEDDEIIQLSEIQGNTMVNCNKDTDKELILMPNLDTNGYSNVTLTEGVDGGKVDIALEGNTMVNVCDQEDPIAITKNYEVTTGNHIALQGEYDGKCRPNIYGNTLVNLVSNSNKWEVGCSGNENTDYTITSTDKQGIIIDKLTDNVDYIYFRKRIDPSLFKPNTIYTIIFNCLKGYRVGVLSGNTAEVILPLSPCNDGYNIITLTSTDLSTITGKSVIYAYVGVNKAYIGTVKTSDFIVLEGDYTNKPIPDYFTGMKSSFEDKLVPENLYKFSSRDDFYSLDGGTILDGEYIKMTANSGYQNAMLKPLGTIKPSTTYTIVVDVVENTLDSKLVITAPVKEKDVQLFTTQTFQINAGETGIFTQMVTTSNDLSGCVRCLVNYLQNTNTTGIIKYRIIIVEGDYTNYDFTDYDSTKGGKYKVDYKVTGKNLFNFNKLNNILYNQPNLNVVWDRINQQYTISGSTSKQYVTVGEYYDTDTFKHGKTYTVKNYVSNNDIIIQFVISYKHPTTGKNTYIVSRLNKNTFTYDKSWGAMHVYCQIDNILDNISPFTLKFQIEEGDTATTYEPYKEYTKTLYLNSPLLEGDTIEQSGNDIVHMHKYNTVTFDGSDDEKWSDNGNIENTYFKYIYNSKTDAKKKVLTSICDKLPTISTSRLKTGIIENTSTGKIQIGCSITNLDEFKQWLQQNPITVVYELATPTREVTSTNDNLLLDSYVNGHLDVDSVIPIDKVVFESYGTSLKYLSPNTEYIIQFESDSNGKLDALALNSSDVIGNLNIVKGINKFNITTSDEITINYLWTTGIGFNMSKIVVTPKVEQPFGYFKGMKSVGQDDENGHKIEILSRNKNLYVDCFEFGDIQKPSGLNSPSASVYRTKDYIKVEPNTRYSFSRKFTSKWHVLYFYDINKKYIRYNDTFGTKFVTPNNVYYVRYKFLLTDSSGDYIMQIEKGESITNYIKGKQNKKEILLNEPLRGLPNGIRDKYVIIDGKWYIERNCGYSNVIIDKKSVGNDGLSYRYSYIHNGNSASISSSIASKTMFVDNMYGAKNVAVADYSSTKDKNTLYFHFANMDNVPSYAQDLASFREFIDGKVINIVFLLNTPTYEPIDYNPLEVYTDTTHISNNSNIPCNMVIRNTGYNCILKPNTKYTVSSSNGLSIVTTKDSIGDGILRFCNKDTSKITKMNKVLVLEGDYVTGNPPIPAFFKGMESAFEQELVTNEKDEHYGKYKVNVKAVGKNLLDATKGVMNTGFNSKTICIKVKSNATYVYSSSVYKGTILIYELPYEVNHGAGIDKVESIALKNHMIADGQSFTTVNSTNYILMNYDNTSNVQLEQGTKATAYEPYKENNITFYLKEPLRGVGNVKDKVYVKEDKVVVQRNCGHKVLDGTETSWQAPSNDNYKYGVFTLYMPHLNHKEVKMDDKNEQGALCNTLRPYWWWTSKDSFETVPDNSIHYLAWDNYDTFYIIKKNLRTVDEFKQWLKANKTEYIYPLAEPVYEEVECDLSKLALEGYDHGTLFYDTNIPVTTQFYEFNINIKDMLIPNETYYVTFNADRVKDITINLSGVQVNYKTSMGYNKVPVQLGDVVNTNFSMDSRGVGLSDLMISTSTSLIYVKDMNDVCVYDEATNKYSITITSTGGNESDKRVILLDYPLLRLNKDIYDRLYYSNKDSRYRIDKKVFKHKFTNNHEYNKYAAETNDTYYSSFISLNETIKDYVVITNEKVKTVKVEDDKYYFKIKWSDLGVSDKTEANGNQGVKDFFNNNEVYLYYATDGFVEIVDGLRRQTLKVYQPETFMKFSGNTTTTVTILIPMKNV